MTSRIREQICEIKPELEVVIAVADLHDQARCSITMHTSTTWTSISARQFDADSTQPFTGSASDDLVQLRVSFPPHQFAGIKVMIARTKMSEAPPPNSASAT